MNPAVTVRVAGLPDAGGASRLHARGIGEGFLASLGPRFLERLYRRMIRSSGSFLIVAVDGPGGVCGFVAGTEHTGRLYAEFLRRDGLGAAVALRGRLVTSGRQALETLRYARASSAESTGLPAPELLSLAVSASQRGTGVGRALIAAFQGELERRGHRSAKVTVAADNRRALEVYEAAGFRLATRLEVHRGRPSEVMVWQRS